MDSIPSGGGGINGTLNPPTNHEAATSTSAADAPKQNLKDITNSTEKTLGLLHQLYLTVSSFNSASHLPLLQRLNSLVSELDNMSKLSDKCNIQLPVEVLKLLDEGKNPDEFTKEVINGCIGKNQVTRGKTDSFKLLRKHLLEDLEQAFPDEVETYREIRASSAAEAKRLAEVQSALPNGDLKWKMNINL